MGLEFGFGFGFGVGVRVRVRVRARARARVRTRARVSGVFVGGGGLRRDAAEALVALEQRHHARARDEQPG